MVRTPYHWPHQVYVSVISAERTWVGLSFCPPNGRIKYYTRTDSIMMMNKNKLQPLKMKSKGH